MRPVIEAFRALRYAAAAGDPSLLLAPPYDVISASTHAALLARSARNIVRLERPEVLSDAATKLQAWRATGILVEEDAPAVYVYEQEHEHAGKTRVRRSFFARVRLEDPPPDAIRPHEATLAAPKQERLSLLRALRTQVSPVFSLYRAAAPLDAPAGAPAVTAAVDGVVHRLWVVQEPARVARVLATVDGPVYLADGHHRYATALLHREQLRADAGSAWTGSEPENYVAMALAPIADLLVLPWHRLVLDPVAADARARLARELHVEALPDLDPAALVARLAAAGAAGPAFVALGLPAEPGARGSGASGTGARADLITPRDPAALAAALPAARSAAWQGLDVSLFEEAVLGRALGIDPGRVAAGALGYTTEAAEAAAAVAGGRARLAFLLNPTRVEQVLAVADAGDTMPQKSTCFHPKVPAGLVLYPFDGGERR